MEINENKKIEILLSLLNERYNASHKMRGRSLTFTTWILGFGIAMAWILIKEVNLTLSQKIIFTVFIIILGGFTINFLYSIEVGFNKNRKVMIDIEKILGCYEINKYSENSSLYPKEYKDINKKLTWHFVSLYLWVFLITTILVILVWI